jgi:hypothetical protein
MSKKTAVLIIANSELVTCHSTTPLSTVIIQDRAKNLFSKLHVPDPDPEVPLFVDQYSIV